MTGMPAPYPTELLPPGWLPYGLPDDFTFFTTESENCLPSPDTFPLPVSPSPWPLPPAPVLFLLPLVSFPLPPPLPPDPCPLLPPHFFRTNLTHLPAPRAQVPPAFWDASAFYYAQ